MDDVKAYACWCGKKKLELWSADYFRCPVCGTLVDVHNDGQDTRAVVDDGASLYDVGYWFDKMLPLYKEMGYSSIEEVILYHYRERAAFWMQHFLRHALPPGNVLEIGCGLGTFCHWLQQLGFDAHGTEMSPVWRRVLQEKLGIFVSDYTVGANLENANRFDAIVLLDVLEHISTPMELFAGIAHELKTDGIVMIQMPEYDGVSSYDEMLKKQHSFLRYLLPREHVFLYSHVGVRLLLRHFGFTHIQTYPSIFPDDMFLFASRASLRSFDPVEIEKCLMRPERIAAYAALKNWQYAQSPASQAISLRQRIARKFNRIGKRLFSGVCGTASRAG